MSLPPKSVLITGLILVSLMIISQAVSIPQPLYPVKKYLLPVDWESIDRNNNSIDDNLEDMAGRNITAYLILTRLPQSIDEELIREAGLRIRYVFRKVVKGFLLEGQADKIISLYYTYRSIDLDYDGYSDALYVQATRKYSLYSFWSTRETDVRPRAWNLGYFGRGVRIAVLDTGIYLGGRGFNNSSVEFHDLVNGYTTPYDEVGHGTMVSYLIAGSITPQPRLGEGENETLTTYIDYVLVKTYQGAYLTGPFMVTGKTPILKYNGYVVLYNSTARGLSGFIYGASLVHYPSYTINNPYSYDKLWRLNVNYKTLSNGYVLANLTLENPISNPPKGLYYAAIYFDQNALGYLAEVMGRIYLPIMRNDNYWLHSGVAPEAGLVVFKVGDRDGIDTGLVTQALDMIADWNSDNNESNDVNVVSMSFGGSSDDPTLHTAIQNALNYGVLSVVAAGNDGYGANYAGNTYPAAYPEVLTVAASNTIGNITSYSSMGGPSSINSSIIKPDVVAPGGSWYGPLTMRDSDGDGEVVFETGDRLEISLNDTQSAQGTSFSTPQVAGLAGLVVEVLREHGVWLNDAYHALLVKSIITSSSHETYPLQREEGRDYSPSLDHGWKDVNEGYGMIDGYAAIKLALRVADYLEYVYSLKNTTLYDYGPHSETLPLIHLGESIREGVLYGITDINEYLYERFGPSSLEVPVHFEKYDWLLSETIPTRYGARLLVSTSDPGGALYDLAAYMYDQGRYDLVLLNNTASTSGVIDEYLNIKPPSSELTGDYLYIVSARRSIEDSPGGNISLFIGPGLTAEFVYGRYIWINSSATAPPSLARYALIIIYYVKPGDNTRYVYAEAIANTTSLNNLAHIEGYIRIVDQSALQDDYDWYVGIVYTRDKRSLSNLTSSSVVEGPVEVRVRIGEPVVIDITGPLSSVDNTPFKLTARLIYNDTGQPIPGKTVYFYKSSDLSSWELIGSNTTDSNGYAVLKTSDAWSGVYYYLAYYPGDNYTQYNYTPIVHSVTIYLRTSISILISNQTPYTVQPVNITVQLYSQYNHTPLTGENITIWVSSDNGASWRKLSSGQTGLNGYYNFTTIFLASGSYLVKANYTGNSGKLYLPAQTSSLSLESIKTPTNASISLNDTRIEVYDTVAFITRLNYTYNGVSKPVTGATIILEYLNNTQWVPVDSGITDSNGYAVLTYRFERNGTYVFRIYYQGNETFKPYISNNITLVAFSRATRIELVRIPKTAPVNGVLFIEARLLDDVNSPVPMVNVTLQKQTSNGWINITTNETDNNGYLLIKWSESIAGNYTYRLYYSGKPYIYNASTSTSFNVSVLKITIFLYLTTNTTSALINETVLFTARLTNNSEPVTGETVYLQVLENNEWINLASSTTNSGGYAFFTITMKYAGNYTFRAYYPGSPEYDRAVSDEVIIEYKPIPTKLLLVASSTAYTIEKVTVKAVLTTISGEPLTGQKVEFWISRDGGVSWVFIGENKTNSRGVAVFSYVFGINGTYLIKANYTDPGKYTGEWVYGDSENTTSITVSLTPTRLYICSNTTEAKINETVNVTLSLVDYYDNPVIGAQILVSLNTTNGVEYVNLTTNNHGLAFFTLSIDSYMIINVTGVFNDTNTYRASSNSTIIRWVPLKTYTSLTASNTTPTTGSTITLTATVIDEYGKPVKNYYIYFYVSRDNNTWMLIGLAALDSLGRASINYTVNSSGVYYFGAVFIDPATGLQGAWRYYSSSSTIIVNVSKTPTTLILSINTSRITLGETVELIALLKTTDNIPVNGAAIAFYYNNGGGWKLYGYAVTNESGEAIIVFKPDSAGNYTFKAVYAGSNAYASSMSNNVSLTVYRKPSEIIFILQNPAEPYPNTPVILVFKLQSMGEPISNGAVAVFINNSLYGVYRTSIDGLLNITVKFAVPGNYTLTLIYNGTDSIAPVELTYNITVKYSSILTLNVTYEVLGNGSILFKLVARLLINNQPASGRKIYFYKKGSWVLIGTNTTNQNGTAILYWLDKNPSESITFKAEYPGETSSWPTTVTRRILVKVTTPMDEPPITSITIAAALIILAYIISRRKRNK